uniref:uncharacterized protein LOC101309564 isoform X2 n=1 Tax=Fragaria vesca subsp. vesca TaxID=101020 RepID=UPI0005C879DC|nr:PREDICTED: uncharacterized protein LOC101309564 isoform X2 [Fragaria vesca subsp. vesca]
MVLWSNPEAVMEALLLMYKLMRGLEVRQLVTGYLTAMVLHRKQQGVVLIKDCLLMHKFMRSHKIFGAGEAFNHLPPVRGQSPYSSGSPMKLARTSSQRLSGPGQLDDGFQGEAFTVLEQPRNNNNTQSPYSPVKVAHTYSCQSKSDGETSNPLPATLCNGQSLCSSPSPDEILSAPSDAYRQFCERFQGCSSSRKLDEALSDVLPSQRSTAAAVPPLKTKESTAANDSNDSVSRPSFSPMIHISLESTSPRSSEMVLVYLPTQLTLFVDNDLW